MTTGAAFPNFSTSAAAHGCSTPNGHHQYHKQVSNLSSKPRHEFQVPLHYPRYTKSDYEKMPEWQVDRLLSEYGLPLVGDVHQKRKFAMGAFLWPDQL